jgi:hypothetical protein
MIGDYRSVMTGGWWDLAGLPDTTEVSTGGWWNSTTPGPASSKYVNWIPYILQAGMI